MADALSRRPNYEIAHVTILSSSITDLIRASYAKNDQCVALLRALGSDELNDSAIELSVRSRARLNLSTTACGGISRILRIPRLSLFLIIKD